MELVNGFDWRAPLWLVGMGLPFIWFAIEVLWARKQQTDYAERQFWPWVKLGGAHSARPAWLISIAWLLLMIALAGPRWAISVQRDAPREGVDTLVLLDLSRSMSAQDQTPNRLVFAQNLLESFSRRLEPADRIGLVGYGVQAHWTSPLSWDKTLFTRALYLLEANQLPLAGAQVDAALQFAIAQLSHPTQLVLVSDSAGRNEADWAELVGAFKASGHSLIVLGVGQSQSVYMPDLSHASGWYHYDNQPISVPIERQALRDLAAELGGVYFDASAQASLLAQLSQTLSQHALAREASDTQTQSDITYLDLAWVFVLLAVLLLMFATMFALSVRWPGRLTPLQTLQQAKPPSQQAGFIHLHLLGVLLGLVLVLGFIAQPSGLQAAAANPLEQQAYEAFLNQDYDTAQLHYQQLLAQAQTPDQRYRALLGSGNVAYRLMAFSQAAFWYRQALLQADSDVQRAQALYNLANANAQLGLWGLAVEAFADVLRYQPDHLNAQHNLMLAKAELAVLLAQPLEQVDQGPVRPRQDLESAFRGSQSTGSSGDGDPNDWGESQADREGQHQGEGDSTERPEALFAAGQVGQQWQLNAQVDAQSDAQASLQQQRRQRRLERLGLQLNELADDQKGLLSHLFERESGFQARQEKPLEVEGVKPW
ncbi:vWA domain-containing protein [Thiomicrospira microaerophila]|uniref:vWA domain-containing protein n=1 Tax=Thiomicrospira microaerophila TaxID=406020 RepID=UPI0005C93F91|nr:VWA domain-containing protein [Thiomicrospira microaerophila]